MAKYWVRTVSELDMFDPDLSEVVRGRGQTVNEHTIKISYGDGYATTIKGDFDLNKNGAVTGGTITRIDFENDEDYGTIMSGVRVDLGTFLAVGKSASPADDGKLFASIFSRNDQIDGDIGDDKIKGFAGNDTLNGGFGDDVVDGGEGADKIIGGSDADRLTGGPGADIFIYRREFDSEERSSDTISDFSQSEGDKISLQDVGFFDFTTEIRVSHTSSQTIVEVDVFGGFDAPLFIRIDGIINLVETDFLL